MSTNAAISIDRFRRTRRAAAPQEQPTSAGTDPVRLLVGATLGTIERRYGLMSSEEAITLSEVVAVSGDLAVADRLAFVAAMERRTQIAVVECDGWYVACATERALMPSDLANLRAAEGAPRVMSLASDRGITPALGPLVA